MDLTEYTDEQLNELEQALAEERDRRYILANMPGQIEQLIASYQDAIRFAGKNYESLRDGNVWTPAAYPAGWKELT